MRRHEGESVKSQGTRTRRTFWKNTQKKKITSLPAAAVEVELGINIYIG